jgi:hypothetical protein
MAYGEERFCADLAAAWRRRHDRAGRAARRAGDLLRGLPAERPGHGAAAGADHTDERIELACEVRAGSCYLVSVAGTTGSRQGLSERVAPLVGRVRPHTELPLLSGRVGSASGATL